MPSHMDQRDGFYYLIRAECPPVPTLGFGHECSSATINFTRQGWYGPSYKTSDRWDRHDRIIVYERSTVIVGDLRDSMRDLAGRLRRARWFGAE